MPPHQILEKGYIPWFNYGLQIDRGQVRSFLGKISTLIEHIGNSAAHAGGKIPAAITQHNYQSVGHVFATVVTDAFNDSRSPGVANREALACHATEERL